MRPWQVASLCGAFALLAVGGLAVTAGSVGEQPVAAAVRAENAAEAAPLPKGHLFTREETYTFLDAAKRAESISDPLKRCIAYPDPPGSHWDQDAKVAYCKYHYQPIITAAQVEELVQGGHTAELDRRFERALQEQMTQPDARGRLDHIFYADFNNGSFDIRPLLDAWKHQSPDSAFAYAASGYAYVQMAFAARGGKHMSETPQSDVDSMNRIATEADADLRHAISLNPHIAPAYAGMISLGGLTFGRAYAVSAAQKGLASAPNDWNIYNQLMWLEEPKWGGSLTGMAKLTSLAQAHAQSNPLLKLLVPEVDFYRIDNCNCSDDVELPAYAAALDRLASSGYLVEAGESALDAGNPQLMTIYMSEALRFDPDRQSARIARIYGLIEFDEAKWAVAEGNRVVSASPDDESAVKARGLAYEALNDYPHAEKDFLKATELNPEDMWIVGKLGYLYIEWNHQWNKAWDAANEVIARDRST